MADRIGKQQTTLHGRLRLVPAAFATISLALALAPAIRACITGTISGIVTDPSGAVIPAVKVVALNTRTGVKETTTTDTRGFYSFPSLAGSAFTACSAAPATFTRGRRATTPPGSFITLCGRAGGESLLQARPRV